MLDLIETALHQADRAGAYRTLRNEIETLIGPDSSDRADAILSLVFDRLISSRPDYFQEVLDGWGKEISERHRIDPCTLRLIFSAVIGRSPLNGAVTALERRPDQSEDTTICRPRTN